MNWTLVSLNKGLLMSNLTVIVLTLAVFIAGVAVGFIIKKGK